MIAPNPFTPQSGWEPRIFGGRDREREEFKKLLKEAVSSRPNHLVLLGEWGVGKTSLLKQYRKLVQEAGWSSSFCAISRFTERDTTKDGINLICQEMLLGFPKLDEISSGLSEKERRLQPQVQLTKFLLKLWKLIKTDLAVVFLDDSQNLLPISNTIDILRAVLSKEEVLKDTNYLFVLSSTPQGWKLFLNKHDPVGRFFRKRQEIVNLTQDELLTLLEKTLKNTGVIFEENVKRKVFEYTNGHPYEVQLISSHLYELQIEGKVTKEVWETALNNTLKELGRDFFLSLFSKASEREKDLIKILIEKNIPMGISDFRTAVTFERRIKKFPIENIKNFLYRLQDKGIIVRLSDGRFDISDRMFKEFIKRWQTI